VMNKTTIINSKTFSEEEKSKVHTLIRVELPFAVHGLAGQLPADEYDVMFQIKERQPEIADLFLGGAGVYRGAPHLKLVPDPWGYVNYTEADVVLKRYEELPGSEQADAVDRSQFLLHQACRILNPILDCYCLASDTFAINRVSPRDFAHVAFAHFIPPIYDACYNITSINLPETELSYEPPATEPDSRLVGTYERYASLDDTYLLAYRLYAEAQRAYESADAALAAIQAMMAIEVALPYYIKERIKEHTDSFGKARLSLRAYEESRKDISLSFLLRSIFPLLVPTDVEFPKEAVDLCNKLRKRRNDAIHEAAALQDLESSGGMDEMLRAAGALLDFLVKNHPKSGAT
jgi:hypothetical protein